MSRTLDALAPAFDRRSGIGASLAPAICNLSPWGSPLSAYLYLVGLSDGPQETPEMAWGNRVEAAIREEAELRLGPIRKPPTSRHPRHDFVYASPDGLLADGRGVEIKNVGRAHARDWGEEGTDQVPRYVLLQCQQQAAVFSMPAVEVVACLCGALPAYYTVPRSDALIDCLIADWLTPFWERVQTRRPPEPDWNDPRTPELLDLLHRPRAGLSVELAAEAAELADSYEFLGHVEREHHKVREQVRGRLVEMLGDAAEGRLPDGRTIRRKAVEVKGRFQKGYEYTNFTISKAKERTT